MGRWFRMTEGLKDCRTEGRRADGQTRRFGLYSPIATPSLIVPTGGNPG